jgi:hypothetical protein
MATRNLAWPESILIMDVHPSVGANPPGPTTAEPFAPEALYEIKIDTDDDAVADITFQVRFTPFGGRGADCDAAPSGRLAGRRHGRGRAGHRRGSAGLDGTGDKGDLVAEFPYLGPPHNGSR